MAEHLTTVERDGQEVPIAVEYTYHRASRGARDSLCGIRGAGPPLEPDEPAHVEIEGATDDSGGDVNLTSNEETNIAAQIESSLE